MEEIGQLKPKEIKFPKILHWSRLIFLTGSTQLFIQALGLVSGIVIIRFLPTKEYAFYTLVNTMLGTMTVLSDGGISAGVMAQGGQVWQDANKLGIVMITGLNLRRTFAVFSLLISVPILLYLLLNNGASWQKSVILVLVLIPAFIAALSDSLLEIGPKLWQDIKSLQFNQAFVAFFRLILIGIVFLFPWAAVAIIASGIPRIIGNKRLRKISEKYVNWNQKPDPTVKKEILSVVKRILPGSIYYCISGQITIFIVSIFGNTNSIAQAGALSRITVFLTFFTIIINTLVIPRYARLQNVAKVLFKHFIRIQLIVLASIITIVGIVYLFPAQTLWILGKNYSNLKVEIVLNVLVSCINLVAGICFSLNSSRGWAIKPVISISLNVLSLFIGAFFINVNTLKGVLVLNIFVGLMDVIMYLVYTINKIRLLRISEMKVIIA